VRTHRGTLNVRYLAAPVAVVLLLVGTLLGLLAIGGPRWLALGWLAPLGYLALVVLGGLWIGRGEPWSVRTRIPLALTTMHVAWGLGFLTSPRGLRGGG
jgi:hypothetical protein